MITVFNYNLIHLLSSSKIYRLKSSLYHVKYLTRHTKIKVAELINFLKVKIKREKIMKL